MAYPKAKRAISLKGRKNFLSKELCSPMQPMWYYAGNPVDLDDTNWRITPVDTNAKDSLDPEALHRALWPRSFRLPLHPMLSDLPPVAGGLGPRTRRGAAPRPSTPCGRRFAGAVVSAPTTRRARRLAADTVTATAPRAAASAGDPGSPWPCPRRGKPAGPVVAARQPHLQPSTPFLLAWQ